MKRVTAPFLTSTVRARRRFFSVRLESGSRRPMRLSPGKRTAESCLREEVQSSVIQAEPSWSSGRT